MSSPPPTATLGIDCFMTNPPKPGVVHVRVDGHTVAFVELEELKRTAERLSKLEEARNAQST